MATLKASKQGQQRIRQTRIDKGWIVDDLRWLVEASKILEPHRNWELESPPFASGVSEGTWKAFLYCQRGVETEVFKAYCKVLGLPWEDIREATHESAISHKNFDWHKICRQMLETQKRSIRRQATEVVSEPFYVQLGLVERKHQPRRSSDFSLSPEQGSGFFQVDKEEIIETYEHDEFLEQVIMQGQSKSEGKRIAIIGEPGAGKTTLLEAIAFSPKTPGLPVWISLGSLGDKSLEEYLCQNWLKQALKTSDVTQQQKALEELFKSRQVLLLLDGVDEMPAPSPVEALAKIREELTGWIDKARVVLTCRVNVWDASVNALQGFDTYRTLEFSYGDGNKPDQVREFICQWFSKTEKPELGEPLREKLDEDRHQRIRDLVKNPLRLSLLCQSWYFRQGDLPKTKAALYEQFTRAFYDWKEDVFRTTLTERKELNEKLGLLAREAIDKEKSRFGIRESFAINVMGEDLFNLACKLHWLVHIYNDAETGKPVYAFFHPTFQEYFAACAIPKRDYFLKHIPDNPKQGIYRIFEPQWKEVFSLWLGQPDDEELKRHKKELINALLDFNDGCGDKGFYRYKAYFMVATGIIEFKESRCVDEILAQLIQWSFPKLNTEEQQYKRLPYQIKEKARAALAEINFKKVIDDLIELLNTQQDKWIRCEVARKLGKIDPGNPKAIETLIEMLLHTDPDPDDLGVSFIESANGLGEIGEGSEEAFKALVEFLAKKCPNSFIASIAWRSLGKLNPHFTIGILNRLLASSESEKWELYYAERLGNVDSSSWKIIGIFIDLLHSEDEDVQMEALDNLGNLGADMPEAIAMYDAVVALIEFLHSDEGEYVSEKIAWCLGQIGTGNLDAIDALRDLLEDSEDELTRCQAAESLWKIGAGVSTDATTLATISLNEILHDTRNFYICCIAANKLKRIDPDNSEATQILIQSFCNNSNKDVPWKTADNLKNTRQYNLLSSIVENLQKHINDEIYENDVVSKYYYDILWHCAQNMAYPDFYQAWHGELFPVKALENQLIDIPSQVQSTDKTYPITLDTQSLKVEINKSAITQKLCTKIYRKAGYSEIPTVNGAAQLQQYIPRIQEKLQKPNLALILHGSEPNEHLLNFCYSLADEDIGLYIGLITSQPIEQPLKGFLPNPNQDNLLSAIQSWINEIG